MIIGAFRVAKADPIPKHEVESMTAQLDAAFEKGLDPQANCAMNGLMIARLLRTIVVIEETFTQILNERNGEDDARGEESGSGTSGGQIDDTEKRIEL